MPSELAEPILRPSGRVILIGPGEVTLLFRGGDPHRPADGTWWFTPGGGADPGESTFEPARRELWEETGQREVEWSGLGQAALRHLSDPVYPAALGDYLEGIIAGDIPAAPWTWE